MWNAKSFPNYHTGLIEAIWHVLGIHTYMGFKSELRELYSCHVPMWNAKLFPNFPTGLIEAI
jgi:hypothetical protein